MAKRKSKSRNGQRTSRYGKIRYVSNRNRKREDSRGWWNEGEGGL